MNGGYAVVWNFLEAILIITIRPGCPYMKETWPQPSDKDILSRQRLKELSTLLSRDYHSPVLELVDVLGSVQ